MLGFKDKNKKFHPIGNSNRVQGVKSSAFSEGKTEHKFKKRTDGLGRELPVKLAKIGQLARISEGSGIGSGEVGIVVGDKPSNEYPRQAKNWYQIKIVKGYHKDELMSFPKNRLEYVDGMSVDDGAEIAHVSKTGGIIRHSKYRPCMLCENELQENWKLRDRIP